MEIRMQWKDSRAQAGARYIAANVAIRFPDLKIVMAHLGHPYEGECIATIRKHANVYADCSALHYRPFQLYHPLMLLQEYGVWRKRLFGSDYPFTTVAASLEACAELTTCWSVLLFRGSIWSRWSGCLHAIRCLS